MPEESQNQNTTTMVIFGGTGDLAQRKLLPALFQLGCKGRLPQDFRIIGFARRELTDDGYRDLMGEALRRFGQLAWRTDEWSRFAKNLFYVNGDLAQPQDFEGLKSRLENLEGRVAGNGSGAKRLFYLSVAPGLFAGTVEQLGYSGMAKEDTGWRRAVIEKPFGNDLESAKALNRRVMHVFDESQIYRIDHYLGKETVQNLLVLRFSNVIFEPIWNRNYVDNVQITAAEEVTVEERAGYYDQSGVIRDMVQNHLLQLLTMVAMEPPNAMDADSLRNQKIEVLRGIRRWKPEDIAHNVVLGQYQGYLEAEGVPASSTTPTYAALRLYLDNWRWQGVPFYLRTGKAMAEKVTEIVIQFESPPHMMFSPAPGQELSPNTLSLCIQPDEGVHLKFGVKVPDQGILMDSKDMAFHYDSAFKDQAIPEAYERLL